MQNTKNFNNLLEYLIDEEILSFKEAMSISKEYNNNLEAYIKSHDQCSSVRIYDIGDAYSLVCYNDKGKKIYGAEFNFDNDDIFEYMSIDDLEYKLNKDLELLSSEDINNILFEKIEDISNELILEDEGSIYMCDNIEYVNNNGGLFECLKGACCEYRYNICDISDEDAAYSIAYSWIYNINKPCAYLAYLQKEDY